MHTNRCPGYGTLAAALIAAVFLAGCKSGASVTVDVRVPRPLVEPIDAAVGVYYDPALMNYVHAEELEDYGPYRIDIGASQAPVFAQVFAAMFNTVVPMARVDGGEATEDAAEAVEPDDAAGEDAEAAPEEEEPAPVHFTRADGTTADVDGIIAPSIEEVQFAIPDQTGGEFYEVWIRYKLELFDTEGNRLAGLPLIGYGKANQANFGSLGRASPALNEATIWALRDAAALLSFQFRTQPEARNWLAMIDTPKGQQDADTTGEREQEATK